MKEKDILLLDRISMENISNKYKSNNPKTPRDAPAQVIPAGKPLVFRWPVSKTPVRPRLLQPAPQFLCIDHDVRFPWNTGSPKEQVGELDDSWILRTGSASLIWQNWTYIEGGNTAKFIE